MSGRSFAVATSAVATMHAALLAAGLLAMSESITPPKLPVMQVSMIMEQPVTRTNVPPRPRETPPPPPPPVPAENAIAEPPPVPVVAPAPEPIPRDPEPELAVVLPQVNNAFGAAPPIVYPELSRKFRETGTVWLLLHVLEDGHIGAVKIMRSSGFPRLDRAAADAARRWRLTPAKRGNDPVALWYQWPVTFTP